MTCELPDGRKELYLDEDSFKKLLFLKQLETGKSLTINEACELIKEREPWEEDEEEIESFEPDPYSGFDRSLQAVEEEVMQLRTQLTRMVIKYDHCIKELNNSRSKNIQLENEMKKLRTREAALMGQIRKDSAEFFPEEIFDKDLN
jgi:peptidoglycan hydrolase CwlO-like protein